MRLNIYHHIDRINTYKNHGYMDSCTQSFLRIPLKSLSVVLVRPAGSSYAFFSVFLALRTNMMEIDYSLLQSGNSSLPSWELLL